MRSEVIHLPDLDATRQLAQRLSLLVRRGDVLVAKTDPPLVALELGWDEARADGIVIVEWPERAVGYMPLDRLVLTFGLGRDGQRTCVLGRGGSWIERLKDPS